MQIWMGMGHIRDLFRPKPPVFSLVAAAYNVGLYIDDFFASIVAQTYGMKGVELIVVNDGSTDDTGSRIDQWAARYPKLIRCIHQDNRGVAAARNVGMMQANGAWIGFPDPDDLLHPDYLSHLSNAIDSDDTQIAIVANLIRYDEATDTHSDTHPMKYRFKKGFVTRPVHKTRDMILQSVSHAVFRRASIVAHKLKFDPMIRPTFEDGHFANALLIREISRTISFVPDAIYHYRKRAALGSAVDASRGDLDWYTTQIETGYLSLIKLTQDVHGHVPAFIQVNCLYSMLWRFRYLMDQPDHVNILDAATQVRLCTLLARVFAVIDKNTIMQFRASELHKVALLARYGKGLREPLRIQPVDLFDDVFEFQWFVGPDDPLVLTPVVNGVIVKVTASPLHQSLFLDQIYVRQDAIRLPITAGDTVSFTAHDGRGICIRDRGHDLGVQVNAGQLAQLRPLP
jgi:glycosyltransferase involved in cell wall biosynthesis